MPDRILCVDDDSSILRLLREQLSELGEVDVSPSAEHALCSLDQRGPYAVVVSDLRMRGMHGIELLTEVARRSADTPGILMTAYADVSTAISALNSGHVFRILTKPYAHDELVKVVSDAIKYHALRSEQRVLLEQTLSGCVRALVEVLAIAGPRAYGRALELKHDIANVARAAGLERVWELEVGALLSQLGHISVPSELEEKRWSDVPLDPLEQEVLDRVPECGFELLRDVPRLENVALIVRFQAKRWDGKGPPHSEHVSELAIPTGARLLKILGDRQAHLQRGRSTQDTWELLFGSHGEYDPALLQVVRACLEAGQFDARQVPRRVHFDTLQAGDLLLADVRMLDGRLLLSSGQHVTAATLQRLRNFGKLHAIREPILIQPAPIARELTAIATMPSQGARAS